MIKDKKPSMTYSTSIMEIVKLHGKKMKLSTTCKYLVYKWIGNKKFSNIFWQRAIARGENVMPQ
jgi:hypothetical protein